MAVNTRVTVILVLCLATSSTGCALWPQATPAKATLTQQQADWWAANQHRKRYVPGKGYYVEGTSGFFDHEGRKVTETLIPTGSGADEEGFLDRWAPKHTYARAKKLVGQGPNEAIARKSLEEGDALFRQKEFRQAASKYRAAYKRWPDSPLEEESLFKTAESEFFADRYSKAEDEYALLIKKYPSTQYLSQTVIRRFAIGRYWEQHDRAHHHWVLTPNLVDKTRPRFDTGGHALRVYERIRLDDPTGPLSDDAVMATANAHFIKGRWEEADYNYGLLRSEYPKSEHQFQAHLLGLRCKLLRYQGPGYEGGPLDEAEDLATQLLTQFPRELGNEKEKVLQVRSGVRNQRALRDFNLAEYYAKGKYYGASKMYYAKVSKNYPDTQLAKESRSRMEQIEAEPDNPTPPFEWLVNLMPQSTREGPVLPKNMATVATNPNSSTVR